MMMMMRYDHSNQRLIGPGRAQHIAAPLEVLALRGCRQAPAAQKSPVTVTQLKNLVFCGLMWIKYHLLWWVEWGVLTFRVEYCYVSNLADQVDVSGQHEVEYGFWLGRGSKLFYLPTNCIQNVTPIIWPMTMQCKYLPTTQQYQCINDQRKFRGRNFRVTDF